jgi:hypothetical protein
MGITLKDVLDHGTRGFNTVMSGGSFRSSTSLV